MLNFGKVFKLPPPRSGGRGRGLHSSPKKCEIHDAATMSPSSKMPLQNVIDWPMVGGWSEVMGWQLKVGFGWLWRKEKNNKHRTKSTVQGPMNPNLWRETKVCVFFRHKLGWKLFFFIAFAMIFCLEGRECHDSWSPKSWKSRNPTTLKRSEMSMFFSHGDENPSKWVQVKGVNQWFLWSFDLRFEICSLHNYCWSKKSCTAWDV